MRLGSGHSAGPGAGSQLLSRGEAVAPTTEPWFGIEIFMLFVAMLVSFVSNIVDDIKRERRIKRERKAWR